MWSAASSVSGDDVVRSIRQVALDAALLFITNHQMAPAMSPTVSTTTGQYSV